MNGKFWTADEDRLLREHYPNSSMPKLLSILNRSVSSIYGHADLLGLKKTDEYLASPDACRLRREDNPGIAYRFPKGLIPWNKGKHMETTGRMGETQFKKGQRPKNWKPVGSTRISVDGYVEIKTQDGMYQWKLLHRINWEKVNGKIPKGMVLVSKGNKLNCEPDNWEMITKQENMSRNTLHNYPPEIAKVIQLRGALNRQINRRLNEQH